MRKKNIFFFLFFFFLIKNNYCQKNNYLKQITVKDGLPSNLVYSFIKDKKGYLWIATDNGLAKHNGTSFKIFNKENGLPTNDVFELNLDSKERMWIESYKNGLYYIKNDTVNLVENSLTKNGYRFLFEKSDTVFFGTNYNFRFYYLNQNKLHLYTKKTRRLIAEQDVRDTVKNISLINNKSSINNHDVKNIIYDTNEQWIIDKGNSLHHLKLLEINNQYINSFHSVGFVDQINHFNNVIYIINKRKELFTYNTITNKIKFIKSYNKPNDKNYTHLIILKTKDKLLIDDNQYIDHIYTSPFKLKSIRKKTYYSFRFNDNIGEDIYSVSENKILKNTKTKVVFKLDSLNLRLNNINAINTKNIVVSNENGIHNINLTTGNVISNFDIKNTITLSDNYSNIFVGTSNDFLILDKKLKEVKKFNLKAKVSSIVKDTNKNIFYLASSLGVICIEKKEGTFILKQIINELDGLLNKKIKHLIPLKDSIYVIYDSGYSIINKEILKTTLKGQIEIFNFKVKDSSYNFTKKIVLKRESNNIVIENSIKTKINTANFKKYYKLTYNKSNNSKWIEFNESNLKLNQLNSGNYVLDLALKNIRSNSFISNKSIQFRIKPLLWERKIFIYSVLVFIFLIILYLFHLNKERIRKKLVLKNKLNILEMKAIKAQMNPHFIFNSLNNIQSSFLLDDEVKSNKIFINFSKLLRTTLKMSNIDFTTLSDEIKYIKLYLSVIQSNHNTSIEVNFNSDKNLNLTNIKIPVLILQPIVENAIQHGLLPSQNQKKLTINISNNNSNSIKIEIIDNGVGRIKKEIIEEIKKHKSFGTSIIENRISLYRKIDKNDSYGYQIIDLKENSTPTGTKVIITIPNK